MLTALLFPALVANVQHQYQVYSRNLWLRRLLPTLKD